MCILQSNSLKMKTTAGQSACSDFFSAKTGDEGNEATCSKHSNHKVKIAFVDLIGENAVETIDQKKAEYVSKLPFSSI